MLSTMPMLTQSLVGFVVLRFSTLGLCSPCWQSPGWSTAERKTQHGALCSQGKVIFPMTPLQEALPHLLQRKH